MQIFHYFSILLPNIKRLIRQIIDKIINNVYFH